MVTLMIDLFKKTRYSSMQIKVTEAAKHEDAIITCTKCGTVLYKTAYIKELLICPSCKSYGRMSAPSRIENICDQESFVELNKNLVGDNPLNFNGYNEKLDKLREKTGLKEAVITGTATIEAMPVAIAVMDSRFLMASMGCAVGEKLTLLFEHAIKQRLPVIIFVASGGARMHEGIFSLMQMVKVSAAVLKHSEAGLLYIPVLTDPTTGGVTASFAMLGDIILAERGATVGFAGKRVIESTIGEKLSDDFQSAKISSGFIDKVISRKKIRTTLISILKLHTGGELC